ncbi:UPF0187-domain-containing protein [Pseudovirgaria hyperparasitica]|uniref:UPF0187-domain-containing protein n=1 Tax=Pseudovirgaria hyperparasitica TaxID=470096 RepID=A0A6A6WEE2_9PEZI|nr:UPF0187-domain-containing protein [Pseudovirgaria hyperparasitica]KAF2760905.1 UPF0187-domain-containing protein [Pseudovirgaria hyperparasitica]
MLHKKTEGGYVNGPLDTQKHSKWPLFLRLRGSVLPKMILPLLFVGVWAAAVTCICFYRVDISCDSLLLTVLGFVVGLGLSFRSSSAYERYTEGRRCWSDLRLASQNMSRLIWLHVGEDAENIENGKKHLLEKLTALNLIISFAVALKHKLRYEPGINSDEEYAGLFQWMDTFIGPPKDLSTTAKKPTWKHYGELIGLPFAIDNPRKLIKQMESQQSIGNLPLEILTYLSTFVDHVMSKSEGRLAAVYQAPLVSGIMTMNECLVSAERVLDTPLPTAYNIAISQITWVYILVLPIQMWGPLGWITIPGTIFAAYIILGLAAIGREIENPFGSDANDLDLDGFCFTIAKDIEMMTAAPAPDVQQFTTDPKNLVLFPQTYSVKYIMDTYGKADIRNALRDKAGASLARKRSSQFCRQDGSEVPTHNTAFGFSQV